MVSYCGEVKAEVPLCVAARSEVFMLLPEPDLSLITGSFISREQTNSSPNAAPLSGHHLLTGPSCRNRRASLQQSLSAALPYLTGPQPPGILQGAFPLK